MSKIDKIERNKKDLETIERILNGDSAAFAILQDKYAPVISSLIRRMIKNEEDVRDLTQETFIKAYNAIQSFSFNYTFSAWLYKIASNTAIDFLRKKKFDTMPIYRKNDNSEEEEIIEIKDDTYVPDLELLANERKQALLAAVAELPENYRVIIKLRHGEDMDYSEIAERLNLPLGTVKAHLFRARKMLYEKLRKHKGLFD